MLTNPCFIVGLCVLGLASFSLCSCFIFVSWSIMPLGFGFNDEFVCYAQAQRIDGKNRVMKQSLIR